MQIQSDTLRALTQMVHMIGAPPTAVIGVNGASLVCIARQESGLMLYMAVDHGIEQETQSLTMYTRQMRAIANHAHGILTVGNGAMSTSYGAMRWELQKAAPADILAPPEISDTFQCGTAEEFTTALSSVVNSGSGDVIVRNLGPSYAWDIICPNATAWMVLMADACPREAVSFVIRQQWSAAVIQMLHAVSSEAGELLFYIVDNQVVIDWSDASRSVIIAFPYEQAKVANIADEMNWLGTVNGADFHRAVSAIEAACAPDEAAVLSIDRGLHISTHMLRLTVAIAREAAPGRPISAWINTAPTRWMKEDEKVDLWETHDRVFVAGHRLVASWRKVS